MDLDTLDLADPIFAPLTGRRVGIAGFGTEEDHRLTALFSEAGALCFSFQAQALQLAVRHCDVVLVMVDELRPFRVESFAKPVIAGITADSLRLYASWIKNSAFDWFYCPATADELLTRVSIALRRDSGPKPGRAFCLLLADDDRNCHDLFRVMIQGHGMAFRAVEDGRKAVEMARDWQPDLVVLDVNMPGMDGFQTLSALKGDDATKEIPIVMVTANNQHSEVLRGLRLGAKEYILKPFNLMNVLERILEVRTRKCVSAS